MDYKDTLNMMKTDFQIITAILLSGQTKKRKHSILKILPLVKRKDKKTCYKL